VTLLPSFFRSTLSLSISIISQLYERSLSFPDGFALKTNLSQINPSSVGMFIDATGLWIDTTNFLSMLLSSFVLSVRVTVNSHSVLYVILSIFGGPSYSLLIPFPKFHFVEINLLPEVGVDEVASKMSPYPESSGLNLIWSLHLRSSPFTLIITEATFSFTSTSVLELKGRTSLYPAEFL
jgi:hypothetical protein